jgi:tetratricopeptide (TPR) repeat protein
MTLGPFLALLLALIGSLTVADGRQGTDDPKLRAAVDQFFATQQAEDVAGYLALWSATAKRPSADQLKYVFESGDDTFSDVAIVGTVATGDRVRVRVSATRDRVTPARTPGRPPFTSHSTTSWSLTYVREGDEWKLVREGAAVDGLADLLIEAPTPEAREELLLAEPELVTDALLMALSRRGGQAAQERAYPAAQIAFERMRDVARRVGNKRLEGEALQNLANAMYFQRNLTGALQAYEERLPLERERDDSAGTAAALLGIATIRYSFAEYATALTTYREALAIQERLDDAGAIATTLISTGNILYLQGDFSGAIADYSRSRDLNRKLPNAAGEADALEGLGRVYLAQGNYRAALDALSGVLAEGKARNDRNDQGTALLSIGDVHFRLGNLDHARAALVESRTHFEAVKHLAAAGRAWQGLALVDLVASRVTLAEDGYRKSSETCSVAGDKECVASAIAGLAFAQTLQGKFKEGIASYKTAIESFTSLKRIEQAARAEVGLSRALARSGAPDAALAAASHARSEAEKLAHDDVLWRAQVAEAEALRRLRDRPKAIVAATGAVAAVDRLLEVAKIRPSAPVARDSSSAFAMLALLQAEDGDAAAAFESAERMRAHDLRVLLAPGERDISRGMTDREREEERTFAGELVSLHAQLSRERGLPKPDAARIARLDAAITDATQKRSVQQLALFERLPALRTWRGLMQAATRSDVDRLLPAAGTILIEFVMTEETLLVIVARRHESSDSTVDGVRFSTHFENAPRSAIAERVAKLQQPEIVRDAAAWRTAALELVPGLPAVFAAAPRAIVIPHEVLWRVPFEALPVEGSYLADTTSITYAPSVTALVRTPPAGQRATPSNPDSVTVPLRLVAVGAPELAPPAVEELARTAPGWAIRNTATAEQELGAIATGAETDQVQAMRGADATEAALRERLAQADIIHLAVPFRVNGASPLFSPMLLASDAANDGALEAREIMNLDLHAGLAVLSDGASMTMRDAADEVGAVGWAWRAAGVPAIVLPRWAADDPVSTELLAALHRRLRAGDAPDVALQAARVVVRSRRETSAPYYWASWMLIGGQ